MSDITYLLLDFDGVNKSKDLKDMPGKVVKNKQQHFPFPWKKT